MAKISEAVQAALNSLPKRTLAAITASSSRTSLFEGANGVGVRRGFGDSLPAEGILVVPNNALWGYSRVDRTAVNLKDPKGVMAVFTAVYFPVKGNGQADTAHARAMIVPVGSFYPLGREEPKASLEEAGLVGQELLRSIVANAAADESFMEAWMTQGQPDSDRVAMLLGKRVRYASAEIFARRFGVKASDAKDSDYEKKLCRFFLDVRDLKDGEE